ncbi:PTS sugar transporter subunit IIA [bacterium]|nr:PTS sugar transporter subunit IIA [bacterium]
MKLSSLISRNIVLLGFSAGDKESAIKMLVDQLAERESLPDPEGAFSALLEREENMSTGAGEVAFPHARLDSLSDIYLLLAISPDGVDWDAIDGKKVHFIYLVLAPPSKNSLMINLNAAFSELLSDKGRRRILLSANVPADVVDYINSLSIDVGEVVFASNVMRRDVISAKEDTPLGEIVEMFFKHKIDTIPILDADGKIVGEVTGYEVLKLGFPDYTLMLKDMSFLTVFEPFISFFEKDKDTPAGEIMNRNIPIVREDVPITHVAFIMIKRHRRYVYVRDGSGKLVGILSRRDLISKIVFG